MGENMNNLNEISQSNLHQYDPTLAADVDDLNFDSCQDCTFENIMKFTYDNISEIYTECDLFGSTKNNKSTQNNSKKGPEGNNNETNNQRKKTFSHSSKVKNVFQGLRKQTLESFFRNEQIE